MSYPVPGPLVDAEVFWGDLAPCEHLVQIYGTDDAFLASLGEFVAAGLEGGEGVVVIATGEHLAGLHQRLHRRGIDVGKTKAQDRLIELVAEEALAEFMRNDWPDDDRFAYVVGGLIERGRRDGRKVRAFGEMVAVLWSRGHAAATLRLEYLWNKYRQSERFPLFCAYPRAAFTHNAAGSLRGICEMHSRVVGSPVA